MQNCHLEQSEQIVEVLEVWLAQFTAEAVLEIEPFRLLGLWGKRGSESDDVA